MKKANAREQYLVSDKRMVKKNIFFDFPSLPVNTDLKGYPPNYDVQFSPLFSCLSMALITISAQFPLISVSAKKKSDRDFVCTDIRRYSLCVLGWGTEKGDVRERFELMYGWIKLSYPTPPHQGPFYSPSIAEIGFSSALCHSTPRRAAPPSI